MTTLTISRFTSASRTAKPQDSIDLPLFVESDDDHDFLVALTTYQEHQALSRNKDWFSFSNWDGGHNEQAHEGTTCVTLEYHEAQRDRAIASLAEMGLAFYAIETRSNRVLFAIPIASPLDHTQTTRAASLMAEAIDCEQLVEHSYFSTYLWKFRTGGQVVVYPGRPLANRFLVETVKVRTDLSKFIR